MLAVIPSEYELLWMQCIHLNGGWMVFELFKSIVFWLLDPRIYSNEQWKKQSHINGTCEIIVERMQRIQIRTEPIPTEVRKKNNERKANYRC